MLPDITEEKWTRTRVALRRTGDDFAELVSSASDSRAKATVHWSVADTAAHVLTLARSCRHLVDHAGGPPPFSGMDDLLRTTVVDTIAQFNEELLSQLSEREPHRLGGEIKAEIARILAATESGDPAAAVDWVGGSRVPLAGVLAHLLNELQIHGRDMALGLRVPWTVPPEEAAAFFDLFLIGVTEYGYGHLLDGHGPAPKGRIAVEFRSPYTAPAAMVLTDGFCTVEEPGGRPDVRLSFDPVVLNLMLFGRIGKARAAMTGKVVLRGGRRPWTLPGFLRIVRLPS
ncbi:MULTISPECIES: maleylpyruvate isomerase N-terminal domain-containing protein [Thermomonosporaceae]|uniref:maleylpyruvate isomerase N-terminal domain-containing protein n=1 Tax=Thermomonosporaceae TaxID=2012 RepID=UPI00255AC603|nr:MULTISPECIES: maleylpyruvate isomerase N-terminal domain-containing protein [Thermomonosporaceae]MDL4773922.1 maleylpyruvate isomerase N-terminal domain-containing protein [Actinomadura xylanilytica]